MNLPTNALRIEFYRVIDVEIIENMSRKCDYQHKYPSDVSVIRVLDNPLTMFLTVQEFCHNSD